MSGLGFKFLTIFEFPIKLKLKSTECLAIEDSQESLNSAVSAKIKCIIFPGKFHLNKKFKSAYKKLSKLNKNIILK